MSSAIATDPELTTARADPGSDHLNGYARATSPTDPTDQHRPPACPRLDWAALMKRVFATDVLVCDACGGAMRILAVLPEGDATRTILEHLDLPTKSPPRALAPPGLLFDDA
ncbi:MAG: hypothetical protein ABIY55_27755 [Kofleriaceae bacterium]